MSAVTKALGISAALAIGAVAYLAHAAPSGCLLPGTGRAVKVSGNGPAACALSTCRIVNWTTVKVFPCQSGPSCAFIPPYIEAWKAQLGTWAGLPACPTWTNTSTWKAP